MGRDALSSHMLMGVDDGGKGTRMETARIPDPKGLPIASSAAAPATPAWSTGLSPTTTNHTTVTTYGFLRHRGLLWAAALHHCQIFQQSTWLTAPSKCLFETDVFYPKAKCPDTTLITLCEMSTTYQH